MPLMSGILDLIAIHPVSKSYVTLGLKLKKARQQDTNLGPLNPQTIARLF